jgi:alpha-beta hydrolase superfamily lysophospholipase
VNAAALPLAFGHARELFGWLHPSASPSPVVTVLCSAFGNEEVFSHRAVRHLAQAIARSGMPALRFDYHGTGDSAGDELAPGRVAAWVESVHLAIDAARRHTGATRVCLLGVRLGSALATLAAASRDDIVGLVAIAPVVQGRAHVREMKLAHMSRQDVADAPTVPVDGLLDTSNFVLQHEALADMAKIDLRSIARPPAPHMLLIERDDLPAAPQWGEHCAALGARLTRCAVPGYAELMAGQSISQRLPSALIERVADWLAEVRNDIPTADAGPVFAIDTRLAAAAGVLEEPVHIDAGATTLFGLLSTAADVTARPRSAVLMLPAGVGRHIGQGRVYVELARELAAAGHMVLRLDLSGLGESPARPGLHENSVYERSALDDVAAAMRFLSERSGGLDCHVVGHCSGGYNALRHLARGGRAAQLIYLNPQLYSELDRLGIVGTPDQPVSSRAADASSWRHRVWRLAHRAVWRVAHRAAGRFRAELRVLAERGTPVHFIFGSMQSTEWSLRRQAGRTLLTLIERGALTITPLPGADHILSRYQDRHMLRQRVRELIEAPARAASPAPQGSRWRWGPRPAIF